MIVLSSSTILPVETQQPVETQEYSVSRGYLWLTRGIALLLLFAAGMKAWQLATVPVLGEGLLHARWLNTLVVEFELFWSVWLLYGLYPKWTRKATLALFTVFAGVSLYKALSGEASCGCFGAAQVNPWWTTGLDILIVGMLVLLGHKLRGDCDLLNIVILCKWRLACVVAVWLVLAIPVTFAMTSVKMNNLSELGSVFIGADGNETILLEPEKWPEGEFPLLPFVDPPEVREQLKTGEWTVVLYHHDCPKCQKVIKDLAVKGEPNVVCVEVPPYEKQSSLPEGYLYGRLNQEKTWFVETPVVTNVFVNNCVF